MTLLRWGGRKAGVRAVVGVLCMGRKSDSAVLAKPVSSAARSNLTAAAGGRSTAGKLFPLCDGDLLCAADMSRRQARCGCRLRSLR